MEFWRVVDRRHSVRAYQPKPVDRQVLERVVHAASIAPSPRNSQPWRFHVATGETRVRVGEIMAQTTVHLSEYMDVIEPEDYDGIARWYSTLGDAPVVIGVSMMRSETGFDRDDVLLSMGASLENLLLAATEEGLAACVVTFSRWVRDELHRAFEVADDRDFLSLVVVGYPLGDTLVSPPKNPDAADWLE